MDYNESQYNTDSDYNITFLGSFDPSVQTNGQALFIQDINTDGKSDFIQIANHYESENIDGLNITYHLSKGLDFKLENYQWLRTMTFVSPNDFTFGNYYGDGQLDCLYQLFDMFKLKNNDRVNLVESVLNGLNRKFDFNYKYKCRNIGCATQTCINHFEIYPFQTVYCRYTIFYRKR